MMYLESSRSFKLRKTLAAVAVGTALMLSTPVAFAADNTSGTLKGTISTLSKEDLSQVVVTVVHQTRGISRTVKSDSNGDYNLRGLPVGRYTVSISKDGYITTQEKDVVISLGQSSVLEFKMTAEGEVSGNVVQIVGGAIRAIDVSNSTSGITFDDEELAKMPVSIGFESVSMLAPGVVASSGGFGVNSFGGGSGAENGYFINGLNISNLRTGTGSMPLPWEGVQETQVKTGAIGAEFGRFIGGVVNAVAKSGSNEWKFGAEINLDPQALRSQHDTIYGAPLVDGGPAPIHSPRGGTLHDDTPRGEREFLDNNIWASGALIEDTLFMYALYNPRKLSRQWTSNTIYTERETTADRWMVNVDYFINDNHSINVFAFNNEEDERDDFLNYDPINDTTDPATASYSELARGGDAIAFNYHGYFTDDFSMNLMVAEIESSSIVVPNNAIPSVTDNRGGGSVSVSSHTNSTITEQLYIRDQFRLEFNYELDDHSIQFGIDKEDLEINYGEQPNGAGEAAGWWTMFNSGATGEEIGGPGATVMLPPNTDYFDRRARTNLGQSALNQQAIYIQDTWQATDNLVVNLGVRVSDFENTTTENTVYADLSTQVAPRLSAIYDLNGDSSTKIFATFGRYFQPIPANMNIKQASGQSDLHTFYASTAPVGADVTFDADGSPTRGAVLTTRLVESSSEATNLAHIDLDPMYNDEITFGFEMEVLEDMTFGSRFVYRDLKKSIEDGRLANARTAAEERWNASHDADHQWTSNSASWVLLNPGSDVHLQHDVDEDGVLDDIYYRAVDIMLPESKRTYLALENTLSGKLTDELYINASYTWSHGWGNTEGLIRSDNAQNDPGWTMSNDLPENTEYGEGNLPNDRRHAFKVSGHYTLTDELTVGFFSSLTSGGPLNKFGRHPEDTGFCRVTDECVTWSGYANNNFYADGVPSPRGSAGERDWMFNIDTSLSYNTEVAGGNLTLKAAIFNLLNADTANNVDEFYDAASRAFEADGVTPLKNPNYLTPEGRQQARYMTLTARYEF